MHLKHSLLVKKEIEKYHKEEFIEPIDYSSWLSNILLALKLNGEIRCCTDFRDLNKACSKENFPLEYIDTIMNSIIGHEMLSIMDGFLRYNQIRINKEDQHNTTFTTSWIIFC